MERAGPGKASTKEVSGERYEKYPRFDGKEEEYQEWKGKVEDWLWAWKHKERDGYPGLTLRRALVAGLLREKVAGEDGVTEALKILNKKYGVEGEKENIKCLANSSGWREGEMKGYKIT